MKITKHKNTRKILFISIAILVLLLGATYIFREQLGIVQKSEVDYSKPNDDEVEGEDTSEQSSSDNSNTQSDNNENNTSSADTDDKNSANEAKSGGNTSITISSLGQSSNYLQVRSIIKPLSGSGTCTLTMSKQGQQTISQQADIQSMPSYSTCKGFNIDTSSLAKGQWSLKLNFTADDKTASTSRNVTIE